MPPITLQEAARAYLSTQSRLHCALCGGNDSSGHVAGCERGTLLQVLKEAKAAGSREAELSAEVMALRSAIGKALEAARNNRNSVTAIYAMEVLLSGARDISAAAPFAFVILAAERAVLCPEAETAEAWEALTEAVRGLYEAGRMGGYG